LVVIGADTISAPAVGSAERSGLVSTFVFPSASDRTINRYVCPDASTPGGMVIEVFAVLNVVDD
jgi:hypothetical protein